MCSNPCGSEVTCFRPESNRGPYGLLNFLCAALSTTELLRERLIRIPASVHEIRPKIGHLPSSLPSRRIVQDFRKCPSPRTYSKYKREKDKVGGKKREENKIKAKLFQACGFSMCRTLRKRVLSEAHSRGSGNTAWRVEQPKASHSTWCLWGSLSPRRLGIFASMAWVSTCSTHIQAFKAATAAWNRPATAKTAELRLEPETAALKAATLSWHIVIRQPRIKSVKVKKE